MLDIRWIRQHPDDLKKAVRDKGVELDVDRLLALDAERRERLAEVERLKHQRNRASEEVARRKRAGQPADELIEETRQLGERIRDLDARVREVEAELQDLMWAVPNVPDPDVPVAPDESGNVEIRRVGQPRAFDFEPKPHWEIGAGLDGLDFERAAKVVGARFVVMKGDVARLHRALVSFFIDFHTARGYREVLPPVVVNTASYYGSGQFPKFREDVFALAGTDYYLSSTAEVPLINLHRDEILDAAALPIKYCGYSGCFRSEAGAAGRDTRGLIRQHYFEKVEMVQLTRPEQSAAALEEITASAEELLRLLGLPYRVLFMCTGDMGFTQSRKYDLEVWMPSYGLYREISSCSNVRDFQARRANIRYRDEGGRLDFVHALNGSGLAVGRTLAAVLENYQQADGSVDVPEPLWPYTGGLRRLEPRG